ncbi:MAG: shikimate dehydrogenase [Solirubrobacteraceae bacterium]|nr:shikimate dehydrogenase [Solirubrobacteraceae bacterium]
MTTRLGVCGWPVSHSRSPAMHNAALRALGLGDWRYQRLPIPPADFPATVKALEAAGFRGVNVTIPHKQAALAIADQATATAEAVGAANMLTLEAGRIAADNTDVRGLLTAIGDHCAPAGRRALVLGAGGAGRAAVHALVQAGAADVQVWNRTPERAERLAGELGGRAVTEPEPFDLVVQCTSVGLRNGDDPFKRLPVDADAFAVGTCVVDMVYSAGGTAFLAAARAAGADVVDGLEILVGQGAASLEHWIGRPVPIDVMRRAVQDDEAV